MGKIKYSFQLHKIKMTIHFLPGKGYDSNIYLVSGREPILVDTGTGSNADSTIKTLATAAPLSSIKTIILTHRHYDHVGGASFLAKNLGADVYIHAEDAKVVSDGDGWGTMSRMFGKQLDAVDVIPIHGGKLFETGEHILRVIHTPGHSAGSISLYDDRTGDLISGDTVFVEGVGRWDLPSGDYETLLRSIKSLQTLYIENLYPGHGPCGIGAGNEKIEQALSWLGES